MLRLPGCAWDRANAAFAWLRMGQSKCCVCLAAHGTEQMLRLPGCAWDRANAAFAWLRMGQSKCCVCLAVFLRAISWVKENSERIVEKGNSVLAVTHIFCFRAL